MTQEELQVRLGKALSRAIKAYHKDGGKLPERIATVVTVVGPDGEDWSVDISYGGCEAPGSIFINPL
jgi:hypothetical protein